MITGHHHDHGHAPLGLVVFDLGGVLVRIARTWQEACEWAGVPFDPAADTEAGRAASGQLAIEFQLGRITEQQYYGRMAAASGGAHTAAEVERVFYAWTQQQFEDVEAIFDLLEARGIATAVFSNTNAAHWQRLANLGGGTPEYPVVLRARHHFASHLLGLAKPDPAIYAAVIATTTVEPHRILFFDDVEAHTDAARAAGWHAKQIDPTTSTAAQMLGHLAAHGIV